MPASLRRLSRCGPAEQAAVGSVVLPEAATTTAAEPAVTADLAVGASSLSHTGVDGSTLTLGAAGLGAIALGAGLLVARKRVFRASAPWKPPSPPIRARRLRRTPSVLPVLSQCPPWPRRLSGITNPSQEDAMQDFTASTDTAVDTTHATPTRRSRLGRIAGVTAASALVLGGVATAIVVNGAAGAEAATASSTTTGGTESAAWEGANGYTAQRPSLPDAGYGWSQGETWTPGGEWSDQSATAQEAATTASDSESTGVVLIDTVVGYDEGIAAGTGMVLSSDGLILTNHHVVADSTEITVTLPETGETYAATVIGADAEDDVALLQLDGASGLTTVTVDDDGVAVGDEVTAVGNAEGGGVLMAATGSVTELDSEVTTQSDYTSTGETLDGMIQFAADVVSGDSGGALIDAEGEVIGMTTAASSGTAITTAFAVPIEDALTIAEEILAGDESNGVAIGYPAMLGVGVASDAQEALYAWGQQATQSEVSTVDGAQIAYVYEGMPAAELGLVAGDVVTAVDGVAVDSSAALAELLAGYEPGDSVTLTWTDAVGTSQTGTVALAQGPLA